MPRSSPRLRVCLAASILASGLLTHGATPSSARAEKEPVRQRPQRRQVLVVTANMQEAWDPRDNADPGDLRAFVKRLKVLTPHPPDVLLLQEVTRKTTAKLVRILRAKTSQRYAIAVSAGKYPVHVKKNHVVSRETSIVINARRMKMRGKPALIDTTHKKRHGARGAVREVKRNVAALLQERGTRMKLPVASVHFHTTAQLRSEKIARRYRKAWSAKVAGVLTRRWRGFRRNAVVGGDFNAARSRTRKGRRSVQSWWKSLARRGFHDAVHKVAPYGGVDYIFTRTRIAGAGVDSKYRPADAAGTSAYYSDHKLRWALLGRWRPLVRGQVPSSTTIAVAWKALPSAKKIRIQRSEPGSRRWSLAARLRGSATELLDRRLEPASRYIYRVVAWNGAERSTPSRILRLRTKPDTTPPRQPEAPNIGLKVKPVDGKLAVKEDPLAVKLTWRRALDRGGSGVIGYEVWRRQLGRDAELITKTEKKRFIDRGFVNRRTVEYFVVAYDAVGNRSRRSDAATVLPL